MKKRMISLLLCVVMLIGLLPTSALAVTTVDKNDQVFKYMQTWTDTETGFQYSYFVYETTEDTIAALYAVLSSVTAPPDWSADTLTMPATLPLDANDSTSAQEPIRVIDGLFTTWPTSLTSVTLPSKVEIINNGFRLSKLTSITFPSTLKRIGDSAFWGSSLTSVTFPDSLESIGASAFFGSKLQSVTFGAKLTTLGTGAFASCNSLQTVDFPNVTKLTTIPENTFKYCALTSVTLPDCVTSIGEYAFYGQGLKASDLSFKGTTLTSLSLGSRESSRLQDIGAYAFGGNSGLTGTLTLPNSVSTISSGAFSYCGFTNIEWPQDNEYFIEVNGFEDCASLPGSVVENLPSSVIIIGERAFALCDSMTEVAIPYSVSTIGKEAFYRSGVSSLTIAPGAGSLAIHKGAFLGCMGLLGKTIDLPARVTQLYSGAFGQIIEGASDPALTVYIHNSGIEFAALDTTGDYPSDQYDYSYCPEGKDTVEDANWVRNVADPFGESIKLELHAPANCTAVTAYAAARNGAYFQSKEIYTNLTRTVTFQEITESAGPVYHTVTAGPQDDVTFTVKQDDVTLGSGATVTVQAEQGKDVEVTAHKEGYYDRTLKKAGKDFTGNWIVNLDPAGWVALPVNGKLAVNITKDGLALGSFDGLNLTLKNGADSVSFTASYPYLVLPESHGLSADTSLTLTVTPDASMQLAGGSATATLRDGSFTVALKSWGKATVTATSTPAAPCVVILFDGDNAVSSGTTSGGVFTSDPLPAGAYTAVAYETNDYFGPVGSKTALSGLGLTSGEDYAEGNVTIADGKTAALTLTVPKLSTADLTSILDTDQCSLAFRSSRAVTGHPFDMQVNYTLKPGHTAQKITFTLPAEVSIQSVFNKERELRVDETNSVTVNNASGTLYVSLTCTGTGVRSIGASVTTTDLTILPLGSGTVTVQKIFLDTAESYTSRRTGNRAEVFTTPNTSVTLTVSGAETPVNGTTNAAGRATLTYDLPLKATHAQSYALTAEVNGGSATAANGGSAKTSITYFPDSAKLQWFGFRHYGYEITVIDNIHPTYENTYYTYFAFADEKSKLFSFGAKFEADHQLDVTVTVTMQDGSVRSVPMTLIGEAGGIQEYGGELYLEGNADNHIFHADSIPVGFQIDWDDPASEPDEETFYEQALASARERQQARADMWEELDIAIPTLTATSLTDRLTQKYQAILNDPNVSSEEKADIRESINNVETLFRESYGDSYSFSFFGNGYHVTDKALFQGGIMTEAEYDELVSIITNSNADEPTKTARIQGLNDLFTYEANCLAEVSALQAEVETFAQQMKDGLGLEKQIHEYNSWEEVLAEKGVTYGECTYTADELLSQGYEKIENAAGDCWVKENGTQMTYVWPNGLNTGSSNTRIAARTSGGGTGGGDSGFLCNVDSAKEAIAGNLNDWQRSFVSNVLGAVGESTEKYANAALASIENARNKLPELYPGYENYPIRRQARSGLDKMEAEAMFEKNFGVACKNIGRGISVYNIYNDGNQMNKNIVDAAEMDAKLAELEPLMQYAKLHDNWKCWDALFAEKRAYNELTAEMHQKTNHLGLNVVAGSLFTLADVFSYGQASRLSPVYDVVSGAKMGMRDFKIAQLKKKIDKLHAERLSICGDDWRKMHQRNLTPILDPSGIVYEAVESNVLSGVTAKIYNVSGGEPGTVWNAGAYNQTNPQTTGADGYYAWDVPSGDWKVEFTKTGYETTTTDTLTVPPPRMNLKTAMISEATPTVVSAAAYPDYVELVFSQYMRVDTLTVSEGYSYEWVNTVEVSAEDHTKYSKVLRLIPGAKAAVGDTVAVTLSDAYNYAGTALPEYFSGDLTVAVKPASLKLNYETQIAVLVGEAKDPRVTVQVLDNSGRPIPGLTVTAAIEDTEYAAITTVQGTTDEDGVAVFSVKGKLPGWTEATFAVAGSSLTKTMPVRVTIDSNQVAKPVATIGGNVYTTSTNSITVPRGSALTLTCATEGATIYYTTNDTCPCQELDRQTYTGPITVNEDTYFRIAAYKDGMEYSERLNLKVSVSESASGGGGYSATVEQPENGSVTVTPQNAKKGDTVTLTPASKPGYVLKNLIVTDSSGKPVEVAKTTGGKFTFVMPAGSVAIKAEFANVSEVFTDVLTDSYYTEAVAWAVENGVTVGTNADGTLFSPDAPCTRAQIVTFLWRAAGSPEPAGTQSFDDVTAGSYYEKAVAWAAENGITGGTGDGKFSPDATCTRAQAVTFLYRAGSASAVSRGAAFTDVEPDAYYADAVAWAAEYEITGGIGGGLFAPGNNCTRAQIVTFLYRSAK